MDGDAATRLYGELRNEMRKIKLSGSGAAAYG